VIHILLQLGYLLLELITCKIEPLSLLVDVVELLSRAFPRYLADTSFDRIHSSTKRLKLLILTS